MPEIQLPSPPTGPRDPHTNPPRSFEYEVLYDDSGTRCGLMAKGDVPGWAMETLCKQEGVRYDPGDTRTEKVRWVPSASGEDVKRWLMPVGRDEDERGAFLATYIDNR